MKQPFMELPAKDVFIPGRDVTAPMDISLPEKFPQCCEWHTHVYESVDAWFKKFPQGDATQAEIAVRPWFHKGLYADIPIKVTRQLALTEIVIEKRKDNPDWYEDITDFIEYNRWCFGQPAIGFEHYANFLRHIITDGGFKIDKSKRVRLIEFIDCYFRPTEEVQTDLNLLHHTYKRWLKEFPFELSLFQNLKEEFERKLPIFKNKPKVNRYSGIAIGKAHTKDSLSHSLVQITDILLRRINSWVLYHKGELKDPVRLRLELILQSRESELQKRGYRRTAINEERQYRKMIKKWYKEEKAFLNELIPILETYPNLKNSDDNLHRETNQADKELSRTAKEVLKHFESMDSKGWKYAFREEKDFSAFVSALEQFFEQKQVSATTLIQVKNRVKTRLANTIGEIYKDLGETLAKDQEFLKVVRCLSCFSDDNDAVLIKALQR